MFKPADVKKLVKDQNFQLVEAEKLIYGIPAIFIVARKELF